MSLTHLGETKLLDTDMGKTEFYLLLGDWGKWVLLEIWKSKEIQPVHSEGDHPWDFFGRNDANHS